MKTVVDIIKKACEFLKKQGIDDPRRDVERVVSLATGLSRLDLYVQYDKPLQEDEIIRIRQGVRRLAAHEPIQYIEGSVVFHGCVILVDKRVLIPRPETEQLVEIVIQHLRKQGKAEGTVLDLCSGSGCIAIAIKKEFPNFRVIAVDRSPFALELSRQNAANNNVDIEHVEGDLFSELAGEVFDCIVCNPPYISTEEYKNLEKNVLLFEPEMALLAGSSGDEYYKKIAQSVKKFLRSQACLFLEIGSSQRMAVEQMFFENGFSDVTCMKDFSDHDRFFLIR